MKQTAVDWFQDQIIKIVNGTCELSEIQIFEQAKAMEKEQIIEAYETAMETDIYNEPLKIGKDYYNQSFKSE